MSEYKFACPVCGQHMLCDSSQSGAVMECPTCFQKITAPQAPATDDSKFILTGSKAGPRKTAAPSVAAVSARPKPGNRFLKAAAFVMIVVLAVAAGIFFAGGNLLSPGTASAWQTRDIGNVGAEGSFNHANGLFTINGSGADTWRRADSFHYVFQTLNGDGSLAAQALNIKNTDMWAKAGMMIRATTNASSMFALASIRADGQAQFVWRNSPGGEAQASALAGGRGAPKWLKIVRSGNIFSAFYKVNAGDDWKQLGPSPTINMTTKTKIGLAVCAHHAGVLCQAQFDHVTFQTNDLSGGK
jgi:hypothetical protein